jgi:subtilisin family serine protease
MNHIIQLNPSASATREKKSKAIEKLYKTSYVKLFKSLNNGFVIGPLDENAVALLKRDTDIALIEPDLQLKPQWAVERIRSVPEGSIADEVVTTDEDVDIFVLDGGIDSSHPKLNVVEEVSFLSTNTPVTDATGHGTAVAGCIASRDQTIGIACGARLHSLKVVDDDGSGPMSASISALDYVIDFKTNNPDLPVVANISGCAYTGSITYTSLDQAIVQAISSGVIIVIAAGNDKKDAKFYTPSHVTEAIVVGSYDKTLKFSGFSNYGKMVDILAPGVDVTTTYLGPTGQIVTSGTSVSGGYVSAAAALIASNDPTLTPSDVRDQLVSTGQASTDRIYAVPIFTINYSVHVS